MYIFYVIYQVTSYWPSIMVLGQPRANTAVPRANTAVPRANTALPRANTAE